MAFIQILDVLFFKEEHNTIIIMYLNNEIGHNILIQCYENVIEVNRLNYLLEHFKKSHKKKI